MNKEKRRVPKLRFPGFTEDWEQRKLGAMCSLFTDGDWIESKDQSNEGIRLIQTGNIGVGKFIDKPENKKWISHSTFDNLRCKELLDGDILISRLPHPAGRACIVSTNNEKWITAVDCTIVRLLDRYSNKFILQSLCTYNYFHLIDSFLAGGTRQRVSRSNLSDINIMSPEKIEQNKIGLFFECVDNLITLHQRKLEHLNLKKKALLQKLFPKNGARYPELRFPGFTDAWEQRKLGEIVNSYSGGTPTASNKEYYGGDIPFIRSAEINSDSTELYITQKGLDNSSAKIVEKGTILYAMYGATSGEVGISKINGAINQAILAMIPLEYNGKIIAQYLRKNKESITGKYLQGGQGNLSANIILELPIQLPGLEESNQIANFLESFDNIITLHQ